MRGGMSRSAMMLSGCTAWMASDAEWYNDSLDEYLDLDKTKRDIGKAVHEAIDQNLKGQTFSVVAEGKAMVGHAIRYIDRVLAPRCSVIQSEVPVGINWSTGEAEMFDSSFIEKIIDHSVNKERPDWQFGIADIVATLKDGGLLVGDWKTGGSNGAKEQLLSLAVPLAKCLEHKGVLISTLSLTEEKIIVDEEPITKQELANHAKAMAKATAKASAYNPGIHCTQLYCPHLAFCPAVSALVVDVSEGIQGLLPPEALVKKYPMTDKPLSDAQAGMVMARVSAAQRQSKYYTAAMKKYIADGGRVTIGAYEWKERGRQGFRWGKQ